MKSLETIKDEYAQSQGWLNWGEIESHHTTISEEVHQEVQSLYLAQKEE